MLEGSAASTSLASAHQAALAAHTGHSILANAALAHSSFFDTSSLPSQDGKSNCFFIIFTDFMLFHLLFLSVALCVTFRDDKR